MLYKIFHIKHKDKTTISLQYVHYHIILAQASPSYETS